MLACLLCWHSFAINFLLCLKTPRVIQGDFGQEVISLWYYIVATTPMNTAILMTNIAETCQSRDSFLIPLQTDLYQNSEENVLLSSLAQK